jgi:hypothetical protein
MRTNIVIDDELMNSAMNGLTLAKRIERDANLVNAKDFRSVLKKVPNIKPEA